MPTHHHTSFHYHGILESYIFPWFLFPKGTKIKKIKKKLIACEYDKEKIIWYKMIDIITCIYRKLLISLLGEFDYKCDTEKLENN